MSWVDAIVFALVAVYFVNIYIFQNYQIPSSSLEKSLLVGDFLYVSKMSLRSPARTLPFLCRWQNIRCLSSILNRHIGWPNRTTNGHRASGKVKLE